jgi:hypothetical protein
MFYFAQCLSSVDEAQRTIGPAAGSACLSAKLTVIGSMTLTILMAEFRGFGRP